MELEKLSPEKCVVAEMSRDSEMSSYFFIGSNAPNNLIGFLRKAKQTKLYGQPITLWNNSLVHVNGGTLKEIHKYVK